MDTYEKKYREALKKAEAFYYSATTEPITEREVLANIFPELKGLEDERMRNAAINACKYMVDNFENSTKQYEDAINWLKSLRPQNNYNLYKEVVESIAEMCKHYDKASHSGLRDFYDNVKVKCKDAKEYDSLFPQNTWKPSDEQMEAMQKALVDLCGKDEHNIITGLYYDLKKLRVSMEAEAPEKTLLSADIEVKVDAGGYPYIPQIELYDYEKDIPLAKAGDKVKVIIMIK